MIPKLPGSSAALLVVAAFACTACTTFPTAPRSSNAQVRTPAETEMLAQERELKQAQTRSDELAAKELQARDLNPDRRRFNP